MFANYFIALICFQHVIGNDQQVPFLYDLRTQPEPVCQPLSPTTIPLVYNVSDTSNTTQPQCGACVHGYFDLDTMLPWNNQSLDVHMSTPTSGVFECCVEETVCPSGQCGDNSTCFLNNTLCLFECACDEDFFNINKTVCGNICLTSTDVCGTGNCTTTDGMNYNCTCEPETHFNRTTCVENCYLDPCLHGGSCQNTDDSFNCTCTEFYEGETCFMDIDECALGTHDCLTTHGDTFTCTNTDGGYICGCLMGFVHDAKLNKCIFATYMMSYELHVDGINYSPAYASRTSEGYKKLFGAVYGDFGGVFNETTQLEYTIREVTEGSVKVAFDFAVNTAQADIAAYRSNIQTILDTYVKDCNDGLNCLEALQVDGNNITFDTTTKLTDAISTLNEPCAFGQGALCDKYANTECEAGDATGKKLYSCECKAGWSAISDNIVELDANKNMIWKMCTDVNECTVTPSICGSDNQGTCKNVDGGYDCICKTGYDFINGSCSPSTSCASAPCAHGGICEAVAEAHYECKCTWLWSGPECEDASILILFIVVCVLTVLVLALIIALACLIQRSRTSARKRRQISHRPESWWMGNMTNSTRSSRHPSVRSIH